MFDPIVAKYYACTQFDAQGVCTAAVWVDMPSVFPPLTVSDGLALGGPMFLALLTVYAARRLLSEGSK